MPVHHEADPIADPGLPPHTWRPTDVDPKAEKRAERQIAAMFVLAMISAVLFVVAYFSFEVGDNWDTFAGMGASTVSLGVTLGMSLLLIGIASSTSPMSLRRGGCADADEQQATCRACTPRVTVEAPMPAKVSQLSPT